ncbi:hypothetical protein J4429_06475 [Candidatus Pacearchaeota archaeon]|nr:hypothetical protein [Candidatus Pacearchaeota archaeon]
MDKENNVFKMKGSYIGGGTFFIIGSFITYLFSKFCFDTCPSLNEIIIAFFIFGIGGIIVGFLIGWIIHFLINYYKHK